MNAVWAAEIEKRFARELGQLRLVPSVESAETEESYWLRGSSQIEEAQLVLSTIPHVRIYHIEAGDGLRPVGLRLVAKPLPTMTFLPLSKTVAVELPRAAYPVSRMASVPVSLVRSDQEQRSMLLETTLEVWSAYASSAPQVRLNCWAFAVTSEGRVLVRGEPLPPLRGQRYWMSDGVAIPIGWTCHPVIAGPVLAKVLDGRGGDLILLNVDGSMESIPADSFVRATRSAVRSTQRAAAQS